MIRRSILVFPIVENPFRIQSFRKKHDPLYGKIDPHITLVFPFLSPIPNTELRDHIHTVIRDFSPFPITLDRHAVQTEGWIWLPVTQGKETIISLHDRLYSGPLHPFLHPEMPYIPHLTIGRSGPNESGNINDWNPEIEFSSLIESITVEEIGEDESSEIICSCRLPSGD